MRRLRPCDLLGAWLGQMWVLAERAVPVCEHQTDMRWRQGKLEPVWSESKSPQRRKPKLPPWKSLLRIAPSRRAWRSHPPSWDGWENSNRVVYIRCIYHREKTPSLAVYPRRVGAVYGPSSEHFHCYGCHAHGSLRKFVRDLRNHHEKNGIT